jgi:hypothetical protein
VYVPTPPETTLPPPAPIDAPFAVKETATVVAEVPPLETNAVTRTDWFETGALLLTWIEAKSEEAAAWRVTTKATLFLIPERSVAFAKT